jgi:hypothetical protein
MKKVVRKTVRRKQDGIDLVADVNAVIAVNSGDEAGPQGVKSTQHVTHRSRSTARTAQEKGTDKED